MIVCLSASHKNVKMPLLELLVFKDEDMAMKSLCSEGLTQECVLVQTCNRVEIYGVLKDPTNMDSVERVLRFWSSNTGVSSDILTKNVTVLRGREALFHLFNTASGLDSMAIGEDQILGQVKKAHARAKKLGSVGLILDKVFMRAINTGKRIRNKTKISHGSISISSAAVDLASKELGDLTHRAALVIGAGEAGCVAAETLKRRGVTSITIANRTHQTGVQLAKKVSGKAIKLNDIYKVIPQMDLAIVALTVDRPMVKAGSLRKAYSKLGQPKRLLLVDISQPRAVEEEVGRIHGVALRNIDSLKEVVKESIRNKQTEAQRARRILLRELRRLERQQSEIMIQPLINEIFRRLEIIRQNELRRALGKMAERDEKRVEILERFSRELMERILQTPIDQLKQAASNSDDDLLSAVRRLFEIKQVKEAV